jgi:hypothetical protein
VTEIFPLGENQTNSIHNYLEIMFTIDVLRFSEFRTMINHLSETRLPGENHIPVAKH